MSSMMSNNILKGFQMVRKFSTSLDLTKVELKAGVKTITMCNQKTRNSLSIAMMQNLIQQIADPSPDVRVIVLSAEGPVFSAGHNLKELNLSDPNGRQNIEEVFKLATNLMHSIIEAPVPIIAKIDGLAAAAGCQLAAQCDIALCSKASKFSTPGANFGIFCSTPGVALARSVPKSTALSMLLTGLPISSADAKASGLVLKVCEDVDELNSETAKICEAIKSKSRAVIELGKRFYYKQVQVDVKSAYNLGGKQMVENLLIEDGREGIRSFVEKRKPVWKN